MQTVPFYMENISFSGGAAIGLIRTTRFATLTINKYKLELNAGIGGLVVFQPSDIISIEPDRSFGSSSGGIRINHTVSGYKQKVIFYTEGNFAATLETIQHCEFFKNGALPPYEERERILLLQANGSFPIKTPASISIFIIWNILCLSIAWPMLTGSKNELRTPTNIMLPFSFLILISLLTLLSPAFRNLIVKEGHYGEKVRKSFWVILAFASAMLIMLQVITQLGASGVTAIR